MEIQIDVDVNIDVDKRAHTHIYVCFFKASTSLKIQITHLLTRTLQKQMQIPRGRQEHPDVLSKNSSF